MCKKVFFLFTVPVLIMVYSGLTAASSSEPGTEDERRITRVRVTPGSDDHLEMLKRFVSYQISEIPPSVVGRSYDYELPGQELDFLEASTIPFTPLALDTNFWTDEYFYSYQEVFNILSSVSTAYPEIASMESLGISTRDSVTIWGLKISDNPGVQEDEPDALIDAVIHAREPVNINVCMALIDSLISGYGVYPEITALVDETEIWVVPIKNPEGYLYLETGITEPWWRKNKRDNNFNGVFDGVQYEYCGGDWPSYPDGVDLNRNYAEGWYNAGSPDSCSIVYHGPSSFSENESSMERDLVAREHFVTAICFHSYSEYVGYCGQDPAGLDLCRDMAGAITREDGFGTYNCSEFYGSGQSYNWMYWEHGVQGYLIETATEFLPSGHDRIDAIARNNVNGVFEMLNRIHGSSIKGHVYDSETLEPLVAEVIIENDYPINNPRTTEPDYGRFYRLVRPDIYSVTVRKAGYEDYYTPGIIVEEGIPTNLEIPLVSSITGIHDQEPAGHLTIRTFSISQNHPNPFNPSTSIKYAIPSDTEAVDVKISIFDVRGRLVRILVDEKKKSGIYQTHWNGLNTRGEAVSSGVYLYLVNAGDYQDTRKMVLVR